IYSTVDSQANLSTRKATAPESPSITKLCNSFPPSPSPNGNRRRGHLPLPIGAKRAAWAESEFHGRESEDTHTRRRQAGRQVDGRHGQVRVQKRLRKCSACRHPLFFLCC